MYGEMKILNFSNQFPVLAEMESMKKRKKEDLLPLPALLVELPANSAVSVRHKQYS